MPNSLNIKKQREERIHRIRTEIESISSDPKRAAGELEWLVSELERSMILDGDTNTKIVVGARELAGQMVQPIAESWREKVDELNEENQRLKRTIRLAHSYVKEYESDGENGTHAKRVLFNQIHAFDNQSTETNENDPA